MAGTCTSSRASAEEEWDVTTTAEPQTERAPETRPYKLIDPFINLPTPPGVQRFSDPNMRRWFKGSRHALEGATFEDTMAELDRVGIEKALMCMTPGIVALIKGTPASHPGTPWTVGASVTDELFYEGCEFLADWCSRSNGRLYGHAMIDPTEGMNAVRRLERSVREFGFVSVHFMPASVNIPANHPTCYPIYAKCTELGIPIKINCGVPGAGARMAWTQQTMYLDEVCVAFPELLVVATHVGHPWHHETVALLQKHANVRLITSGFVPKHVPEEIWHVTNTRASHKVMWSSDWPVLPMDRCVTEGWDAPLRNDEIRRRYLRDNALETFKLD